MPVPLAELIRRYEADETPDQIGASIGVSGAAVRKRLIKAGVAMRGHVASHAKYRVAAPKRCERTSRSASHPNGAYWLLRIETTLQGQETGRRSLAAFVTAGRANAEALERNMTDASDAIYVVVFQPRGRETH